MEQKDVEVPGLVNWYENLSSVSSGLDLKVDLSSLTTVCGMSSRLIQITVEPAGTVVVAGAKEKLSMVTARAAAVSLDGVRRKAPASRTYNPAVTAISAAQAKLFLQEIIIVPPVFDLLFR